MAQAGMNDCVDLPRETIRFARHFAVLSSNLEIRAKALV